MIIEDKLMRYVLYKKRTENEIRQKCISMNYEEYYIEEVIEYLDEKLHRRHPHVFGDHAKATSPEEALAVWREMKKKEREGK